MPVGRDVEHDWQSPCYISLFLESAREFIPSQRARRRLQFSRDPVTLFDRPSAVLDEPGYEEFDPGRHSEPDDTIKFDLLDATPRERSRRWGTFGLGWVIQLTVIAVIVLLAATLPMEKQPQQKEWVVKLTLPPLPEPRLRHVPAPPPKPVEPPKTTYTPPIPPPQPVPKPRVPKVLAAVKPALAAPVVRQQPRPILSRPEVPKWKPKVAVGTFNANPAPAAKIHLPAEAVQTGGFGNPNGIQGQAQGGNHGNVPKLGSFDLQNGPGNGNGLGGTRGARGAVASAGFGSAGDGSPAGSRGGTGKVQAGGFGDEGADSRAAAARARPAAEAPLQPVEILSKPNPVYTQEARELHIQGEVVLQVVFAASGELRVVRVVSGLGHGLDEAAVRAARAIRFKPAERGGKPVDINARLRILFQLAN